MSTRKGVCSVDGCISPSLARGWCSKHYQRWSKYGDPLGEAAPRPAEPPVTRFWPKVYRYGVGGCWYWLGSLFGGGYGRFCLSHGEAVLAHRYAYEQVVGSIPDGLELDHLCLVKWCVNPAHLEPVTSQENTRRWAALITHCPAGHEYTPANTYRHADVRRSCRTCRREDARKPERQPGRREAARRYRERKRQERETS